jgi:DNA-binding MarR family transcriptional regulator
MIQQPSCANDGAPCICGRLRRVSRKLSRAYDEALAPVGLTITQFSILRTLSRMGRPTLADLAEATAHEKSGLWRTLQPLIRAGWVEVDATGGPRRQTLGLTGSGADKLVEAMPAWRAAQSRVGDALGDRNARLIELLREVETLV